MTYFFGNLKIDDSFFSSIRDILIKKNLIIKSDFEGLEDLFRFFYFHSGEKVAKNYLSIIFDIDFHIGELFLDNKKILFCEAEIAFFQKHGFLIYEDRREVQIFLDYLSEEILNFICTNNVIAKIDKKIVFILCEKHAILKKQLEVFSDFLTNGAINSVDYHESAQSLNFASKKFRYILFLIVFLFFSFKIAEFPIIFIIFSNICYFISAIYKVFLSLDSKRNEEVEIPHHKDCNSFPIYTILLPIFQEDEKTINQLINTINNIDYPLYKLDIKILVEKNDNISMDILSKIALNYNFDIITIPQSHPQTKAKACNFAIHFSKGEFLVIYDSDDIPEITQIKIAFNNFQLYQNVTCIQATINSYNYNENWLSKFYSLEFDMWYKVFLPKIHSLNLPVTFGGTSNHFRIDAIKHNLWDSWNVTEDAELGIRWWIKQLGDVKIINSRTMEEAPLSIKAWVKQRSRWIKGFLQTYFIFRKNKNCKFQLWLNIFIFLPIFSQGLFVFVIFQFLILKFHHNHFEYLNIASKISLYTMALNYLLQIAILVSNHKKFLWNINLKIIFFPIYQMILNIPSTYKAIWQLFTRPFFWEKTVHGVTDNRARL